MLEARAHDLESREAALAADAESRAARDAELASLQERIAELETSAVSLSTPLVGDGELREELREAEALAEQLEAAITAQRRVLEAKERVLATMSEELEKARSNTPQAVN